MGEGQDTGAREQSPDVRTGEASDQNLPLRTKWLRKLWGEQGHSCHGERGQGSHPYPDSTRKEGEGQRWRGQ